MKETLARSPSRLKRLLIWSGPFLLVTLVTAYGVRYWRASAALQAEIQRIRDRGEPLRLEELLPAIDPDEDAGPLLREALEQYQTPDEEFFVLLNAAPPTPPGDYRAFREALAANQRTLELVAQAVEKPRCRFNDDDGCTSPCARQMASRLSELLQAQCLQSIGADEYEPAVAAVIQNMQLSRLIRDEPFTLSRIMGRAIAIKSLNSLQELLGFTELSDQDFVRIDQLLEDIEQNSSMKSSVFAERAEVFNPDSPVHSILRDIPILLLPTFMDAQAVSLRFMTDMAEIIDGEGPETEQRVVLLDETCFEAPFLANSFMIPWSGRRRGVLRGRQRMILARFALRVDRYRHEHGELPKTLAQVCDRQLTQVPPDLLRGKPLLYETHDQGFVIRVQGDDAAEVEILKDCRFEVLYPGAGDLQDAADASTQE